MSRPVAGVAILEQDHVLGVARIALEGIEAGGGAALAAFFAPEPVDGAALVAQARGLGPLVAAEDAAILLLRRAGVDAALLARCPHLRLVQRLGERRDGIDLAAAAARGIHVACLPRRTLAWTAEHAILLMLALVKQLRAAEDAARRGGPGGTPSSVAYNWPGIAPLDGLHGRSLGIIGLGEVGRLVALRAAAFGMRILYTNRNRLPEATEQALQVAYRPLPALLAEAEIVSLHASNLPENSGVIGLRALRAMRPDALLINTSRGALVDEAALLRALREGWIAGAGLDVHAAEPRAPGDALAALPNVVLTPHIAGGSRRGVLVEIGQIFENARAVLAGSPPPHGWVTP
jgi:phosphoglycerate dehydrogenase-like enzyme